MNSFTLKAFKIRISSTTNVLPEKKILFLVQNAILSWKKFLSNRQRFLLMDVLN